MKSIFSYSKRYYCVSTFVFFFISTVAFQGHYLDIRYTERIILPECPWCDASAKGDIVYLPFDASIMRLISPANPEFIADALWMRALYYFGKHSLTDQQYPYLLNLLDITTDLAPRWKFPYTYGALIMADSEGGADDASYMIEKGLIHHPEDWQLWFFKGYQLMKEGHNLEAAEALHTASVLPDAPVFLAELSATLMTREGRRDMALRFLQQSLQMIKDPRQREFIIRKIQKVRAQYDATGTPVD